ncbi:MAG: arginine repressor [Clostridia bacterium]|nr:MAG: arginine repressor [Clostridia bacterium]
MKGARRRAIVDIIAIQAIQTQAQLTAELNRRGFDVTQATVSRDVKDLGLVKVPAEGGIYRYALPEGGHGPDPYDRLTKLFADSVVSLDWSLNLIVIRTLPGTAHAVASCLDHVRLAGVIGTVAGDDTILVVVKPRSRVRLILNELQRLLP